jgi:hypothetical protein
MKTAKKILQFFWNLQKNKVRINSKFKDLYKGETCLIFGNGASLKYFDFNAIPQTVAISCAFGLLDKRLQKLNVKYYFFSDSYMFYPIIYNDYAHVNSFQKNYIHTIFKKIISANKQISFFASITNSFSYFSKPSNLYFWHHFGLKDFSSFDLAGKFSTSSCNLDMMIGLARYLGFSKAIIFGCDYLCTPKMEGHFYTHKIPTFGKDDPEYVQRIQKSIGDLDILIVTPKGVSSDFFPTVSFEEYYGTSEVYQSNKEIIEKEDLDLMQAAAHANIIMI